MSIGKLSVETAAKLQGEFEFITSIASDLCDQDTKLDYADWLEQIGDPRSAFVREFASACSELNAKSQLPNSNHYPQAWRNMLGVTLVEGILQLGLVDVSHLILPAARPMLIIETENVQENQLAIGQSKFGGLPDLPATTPWPVCEAGLLGFLGQFDLATLSSTQVARELPSNGMLSFFAYQDEGGYQPGVFQPKVCKYGIGNGDVAVIYTPSKLELVRRQLPDKINVKENYHERVTGLKFMESWDFPEVADLPWRCATLADELQKTGCEELFWNLRGFSREQVFGNQLGGYSVTFRRGNPAPGHDWLLLLCLYSDSNLGWNWCDGERLNFYIQQDQLHRGDFGQVYGYAA